MTRARLPTVGPLDAYDEPPSAARMAAVFAALLRSRRREGLAAAAVERALEVVEAARRSVPFYRDLYGTRPFARLEDVPIIDKKALAGVPLEERLAGPVPPGSHRLHTSGTSGVPFETVFPPAFARWQGLIKLRTDLDLRSAPWTKRVSLAFTSGGEHTRQRAAAWFDRYRLSIPLDADVEDIAERIAQWRPRRISGHPHRVLDVGLELPKELRPTIVATHGETLEPVLRASLEEVYSTRPFDGYGTAEVGAVAAQCRAADLYHLQQESVVIEVLGDKDVAVGPGGTGEIVITGLQNGLMPIIRYRLGDRVTLADRACECGHRGPSLSAIDGRTSDFAVGARGERISPERIWLFNNVPIDVITDHVRRYQIHQDSSGTIRVRLELRRPMPPAVSAAIVASYEGKSAGQPVVVEVVDDVGVDRTGKFRLISSDLADAAGNPIPQPS